MAWRQRAGGLTVYECLGVLSRITCRWILDQALCKKAVTRVVKLIEYRVSQYDVTLDGAERGLEQLSEIPEPDTPQLRKLHAMRLCSEELHILRELHHAVVLHGDQNE